MKNFLIRHWPEMCGALIGAVGGCLYWRYAGCAGGACPITSSPVMSMVWGTVTGWLLFSGLFRPAEKPGRRETGPSETARRGSDEP